MQKTLVTLVNDNNEMFWEALYQGPLSDLNPTADGPTCPILPGLYVPDGYRLIAWAADESEIGLAEVVVDLEGLVDLSRLSRLAVEFGSDCAKKHNQKRKR